MIAAVRDPEALKAIRPLDLAAYLRDTGWVQSEPTNGAGTAWTRAAHFGEEFEVLLAINTELRDYPARMSEALSALEIVEELVAMGGVGTRAAISILLDFKKAATKDARPEEKND